MKIFFFTFHLISCVRSTTIQWRCQWWWWWWWANWFNKIANNNFFSISISISLFILLLFEHRHTDTYIQDEVSTIFYGLSIYFNGCWREGEIKKHWTFTHHTHTQTHNEREQVATATVIRPFFFINYT